MYTHTCIHTQIVSCRHIFPYTDTQIAPCRHILPYTDTGISPFRDTYISLCTDTHMSPIHRRTEVSAHKMHQ